MGDQAFQPGTLVRSLAGHDRGGIFAVLAADAAFVYIADGRRRPVNRPKKKKRRHLEPVEGDLGPVRESMQLGRPVADSTLRRALRQACPAEICGTIDKEEQFVQTGCH